MLDGFQEPFPVNAAYPPGIGNTIASNSHNQREQRREECPEQCVNEDSSLLHDLLSPGLSPPVKYFTDRSKAILLLWIFYVFVLSCVCYVFVRVCLYVLFGHLLGKG